MLALFIVAKGKLYLLWSSWRDSIRCLDQCMFILLHKCQGIGAELVIEDEYRLSFTTMIDCPELDLEPP